MSAGNWGQSRVIDCPNGVIIGVTSKRETFCFHVTEIDDSF